MAKTLQLLCALGLVSSVSCRATSKISLFILDGISQTMVASVIRVQSSLTTYLLNCPVGQFQDCGISDLSYTVGDGFYGVGETDAPFYTYSQKCQVQGTTSASCWESAAGEEANYPGTSTTILGADDITFFPVTITAGLESLAPGSGPPRTTATSTATVAFPGVRATAMELSVVTAAPSSTVYKVGCVEGARLNECFFREAHMAPWLTVGESSIGYNITIKGGAMSVVCPSVTGDGMAVCEQSMWKKVPSGTYVEDTQRTFSLNFGAADVTAGGEKLLVSAVASTSGVASRTASSSSSSGGAAPGPTGLAAGRMFAVAAVGAAGAALVL